MGAEQSTAGVGGLLAARELLVAEANKTDEDDLEVDDVDTLLKKLGAGLARAPSDALHYTCRALEDRDLRALSALAVLQPAKCTLLRSVNLSHNHIGNAGAVALGKALSSGAPAMRKLFLHENRIGDDGVTALALSMRPSGAPHLRDIRLAFNRFGDAGMVALAEAWGEGGGAELRELNVSANEIGDEGFAALVGALPSAPHLQVLALGSSNGGNHVTDAGAQVLARMLEGGEARAHGPLTINLKNNRLTSEAESLLLKPNTRKTISIVCRSQSIKRDFGDVVSPSTTPTNSRHSTPISSRHSTPISTPVGKAPGSPYEA